jgi:hypothetical protein
MKTNLYRALSKKIALTIWPYARWLFRLIFLLFSLSLLAACAPKTEEEQIAAFNKQIAPDGYVTKTHLFIHWPAVYTQARRDDSVGKEIVPAITLKIPMEYLSQDQFRNVTMAKQRIPSIRDLNKEQIDYESRYRQGMFIQSHHITSVYLRLQPGAKRDELMIPYKEDSPEEARIKLENFFNEYMVTINRNNFNHNAPGVNCIQSTCFASFSLKGRNAQIMGEGEALENAYKAQAERSNQKLTELPKNPYSISSVNENSGLPKWHEKVDPALALLNSFILPEDSPEIKGMFTDD